MNRRRFLYSACALAAVATITTPRMARAQRQPLRYADMHTHISMYGPTLNIRDTMVRNGMLLIAHKIVGDGAVIRRIPGKGIQMFREPAPGELPRRYEATLARLKAQYKDENLAEVSSADGLERALRYGEPSVVIGVEGGDFLEGDINRLESARHQGVVHLQLVHYRVSELGDISTERPVHNGLTPFGKKVVITCNRLGILVDVAHGTSSVIDQALALSSRPVVYSHGHVLSTSPYFTQGNVRARAIYRPLAIKIARQGGVVGIWPLGSLYPTLDAYAGALIDGAEYLGADHVAVSTDLPTLGTTVMPGYEAYSELEDLLGKRGVKANDIANMLGRNYLRVLGQALAV